MKRKESQRRAIIALTLRIFSYAGILGAFIGYVGVAGSLEWDRITIVESAELFAAFGIVGVISYAGLYLSEQIER